MRKIEWTELRFPPLNLNNIWPSQEMIRLHAERLDPTLWDDYDDNREDITTTKRKTLVHLQQRKL